MMLENVRKNLGTLLFAVVVLSAMAFYANSGPNTPETAPAGCSKIVPNFPESELQREPDYRTMFPTNCPYGWRGQPMD